MGLKCFVASALGHTDVDRILARVIRPVLRENKFSIFNVKRVDKVEHNKDVDDKIFELLDDADFCIADLTYARPSVYYEAGYASGRGIPVIYMVRSDHLNALKRDDEFRVHFDLQMKNIILWEKPSDQVKARLRRRLSKVVTPLLKSMAKDQFLVERRESFNRLSARERVSKVITTAIKLIKADGFKNSGMSWTRTINNRLHRLAFLFEVSISNRDLDWMFYASHTGWNTSAPATQIHDTHLVLCSLKPFQKSRILKRIEDFRHLSPTTFFHATENDQSCERRKTIHIIDQIQSAEDFSLRFRQLLPSFTAKQPPI